MEVSTSRRNGDVNIFDITETIKLKFKEPHVLESLGSIHNLMIIKMDTNEEVGDQVNIKVQINSSFEKNQPLFFYGELFWASYITLNKLSTTYRVMLPGHLQNVIITNVDETMSDLNILWMRNKQRKYRFSQRTEYCSMKVSCEHVFYNIPGIFKIPGIFYGLVFLLPNGTRMIRLDVFCEKCTTGDFTDADKSDGLIKCPERNSTLNHKPHHLRFLENSLD